MRRILIDSARRKNTEKRGGDVMRFQISDVDAGFDSTPDHLLALDDALSKLDAEEPLCGQRLPQPLWTRRSQRSTLEEENRGSI